MYAFLYRYLRSSKHRGSWSPGKAFTKETVTRGARLVWEGVKKRALLMADRRVFFSTFVYGLFGFIGVMSLEVRSSTVSVIICVALS